MTPRVTVITSAHNEETCIAKCIQNKLQLDYPHDLLEVIVVSDGSTDGTDAAIQSIADGDSRVRFLRQQPRAGKTSALNAAAALAKGEILVFADANSMYAPDALRKLAGAFADSDVGYVTGRMVYLAPNGSMTGEACSLYMRYENFLRRHESEIGSIVGVNGGIDAIRADLYVPMRADQQPDLVLPLSVVERGRRVVFVPGAIVFEESLSQATDEFGMRVRVALRAWHVLRDQSRTPEPATVPAVLLAAIVAQVVALHRTGVPGNGPDLQCRAAGERARLERALRRPVPVLRVRRAGSVVESGSGASVVPLLLVSAERRRRGGAVAFPAGPETSDLDPEEVRPVSAGSAGGSAGPPAVSRLPRRPGGVRRGIRFPVVTDHARQRIALSLFPGRGRGDPFSQDRVPREADKCSHQPVDVADVHEQPGLPVTNHLSQPADPRGHDRHAQRHGFQQRIGESLVQRGHQQHIQMGHPVDDVALEPVKANTVAETQRHRPVPQVVQHGSRSDDVQPQAIGNGAVDHGLKSDGYALYLGDATDDPHVKQVRLESARARASLPGKRNDPVVNHLPVKTGMFPLETAHDVSGHVADAGAQTAGGPGVQGMIQT